MRMNSLPAELVASASADLSILSRTTVGGAGAASGKEEVAAVQEHVEVIHQERRLEAWKSLPKDMIAGTLLGGVAHTIVAPVERAKLLLQTQDSNFVIQNGKHVRYKGLVDCIVRVARDEGFLSLWRGNGSSVMRYYPSLAINFAMKDFYRAMLIEDRDVEDENAPLARAPANFLAGAMAGCTSLVFVYPLDIAHTRLAADIGRRDARQFRGISHFLRTIYHKDGLRGVYRGFPASVQGMVVHRSIYFGGFDTAKDFLSKDAEHIPFWKRWAVAQGITTSAGLISYPLDTVRRRMMMQSGLESKMYYNTLDCWKKIYRQEGALAFYKGAVTNMVRGTGAALILVLYDELKHILRWSGPAGTEARPPSKHDVSVTTRPQEK
ncbi:solute carrier family 25 (mitochondrial adenine nucleotide translocator), member 4/5/6/31 [Marchantia polymorpha subsp. ruderalis]|uniref:ADP/ATP translocase n=3 Tax=Marchantia polymorpha TaxID=3197 RepID=A0AAF6BQX6_MARPO|nr:hypothetical protein MARPO_0016s0183 [Marchantia polymorpha]BBN14410.1 hypothetical protein Mp_6g11440 [Marchantia polymorpha subsp. ruderalis]|eukprot:PTQ45143.1 hypothetical protein MARPO_0016s0183 [Marchantia polymorpha]